MVLCKWLCTVWVCAVGVLMVCGLFVDKCVGGAWVVLMY